MNSKSCFKIKVSFESHFDEIDNVVDLGTIFSMNVDAVKNWRIGRVDEKGYRVITINNKILDEMLGCSRYPETPKRNILREVTNYAQGDSPTANLKLLTSVALKEKEKSCRRKEKSLQILCDRFLKLFPLHGTSNGTEIHLDSTAQQLGVERRRIYDIMNILEALQCATRCRKNTYTWHGAAELDSLLCELRKQGEALEVRYSLRGKRGAISSPKQKSLRVLAQRFLMMFLVEQPGTLINLEMAIAVLISPQRNKTPETLQQDDSKHKSKVRRLYDISNVLSSIGLIEKIPGSTILKKPVFRYKGLNLNVRMTTPPKCSYQMTPISLGVKPHVTQSSSLARSKRKLEFTSPICLPSSSVVDTPKTPRLSHDAPSYNWDSFLQVADMEYSRLKGVSTL